MASSYREVPTAEQQRLEDEETLRRAQQGNTRIETGPFSGGGSYAPNPAAVAEARDRLGAGGGFGGFSSEAFNSALARVQAGRDADLARGRARGEELFRSGALGRVQAGRAAEIEDLLHRRGRNLDGMTPEEQTMMREQNLRSMQQAQAGQARALQSRQALAGVRGPVAAAQQARLAQQGQEAMGDQERQILLNNLNLRRQALDKYEGSLTGARADELGREQFNIGQSNKETFGKLGTELGYGSLGAGERAGVLQALSSSDQARAGMTMANQKAPGMTYLCTDLFDRGAISGFELRQLYTLLFKTYRKNPTFALWYYQMGPKMVETWADRQERREMFFCVTVKPVLILIRRGEWEQAHGEYMLGAIRLACQLGLLDSAGVAAILYPSKLSLFTSMVRIHLIPKFYQVAILHRWERAKRRATVWLEGRI